MGNDFKEAVAHPSVPHDPRAVADAELLNSAVVTRRAGVVQASRRARAWVSPGFDCPARMARLVSTTDMPKQTWLPSAPFAAFVSTSRTEYRS
jgi:hypothetical protein